MNHQHLSKFAQPSSLMRVFSAGTRKCKGFSLVQSSSWINNRKFQSNNIRQFSSTSLNRNEKQARQDLYSYEVYALPTERDYDRMIPDSVEDKQTIVDLNMDIRNVLNYVLFLACDKYSAERLKGYQEHKFSFGKDRLVSILQLAHDDSTSHSGKKRSLESILDKSTTDYIDIIDAVNSHVQYINRELNRLDLSISEEYYSGSPKISAEESNTSLAQCEKDIEKLNSVFNKMYSMADVDPLDDDLIDNEAYHPIALYLKNKMRIVSVKMDLQKDKDKFKDIESFLKMEHDKDEVLAMCNKIQERALLYMSTLQLTKAYSDITLCTHITKLVVTKDDTKKDILITRGLITLQSLIYMYSLLKEYVVIINRKVDFDFTTENPKDLHHFFVENFKVVQPVMFDNQIVELDSQRLASLVDLKNISLKLAVYASNQLEMLKYDLDGKKFEFLDKYQKDLDLTMKVLKFQAIYVVLKKALSFTLWAIASIWLFRFISRKLEGEPLFK
ncbi:predicted protein [Naegleria gruberi]|uniref:Predicted protein n=1 Tax=Naegleria gruberi TaxID=5762 RepID=D2V9R3_NAEGR|nr:uncharacterized protein NAEGRDRAFT_65529 [Naegleria gruberi]EFC46512.1 predicted protein [Naegleria gruberi]|eukprot:XP_002679256.1 predicted protein [Naegleria gruberi strain NEG-M]